MSNKSLCFCLVQPQSVHMLALLYRAYCWCASELKISSCVCLSSVWLETTSPLCPPLTPLLCVSTIQLSTGCIWPPTWCRVSFLTPPSFRTGSHSSRCSVTWPSYWRRTSTGWWMMGPTPPWPVSVPSLSGFPLEMTGNCLFFTYQFSQIHPLSISPIRVFSSTGAAMSSDGTYGFNDIHDTESRSCTFYEWCVWRPVFELGITWILTCSVKTSTWCDSSSCATCNATPLLWRATWCARCSWTHRCGSPWPTSAATSWAWSWWRSTPSSAWSSRTSPSYRRWMEGEWKMKKPERNEDEGLDNDEWTQLNYT